MKNASIKIKISDTIEGFAIAPDTLNQVSNGSWSYLQSFRIEVGQCKWHGHVAEAGNDLLRGEYLWIGEKLANTLAIEDDQTVTIGLSTLEPVSRIQLKAKKGKSSVPFCEGVQPEIGQLIRYEGKTYSIESVDPTEGYIDESTSVEIIGEDGEIEIQVKNPIRKSASSNESGFSQIIGMEDVIEDIITKIIGPLSNPSWAKKYLKAPLKGAILFGPYGVAKTKLARAISEELGIPFYHIPISIATSIQGPSFIQSVYKKAAKDKDGAIVFIDEIDAVAPRNWKGSPITTTLQEAMDGLKQNPKVFTLAATNNLHDVAEGLLRPGRFDLLIPIGLPDERSRGRLFEHFLSGLQAETDIDYSELASKTASFTGADIESVCKNIGTKALSQHCKTGKNQYMSASDLMDEIDSFQPSGARLLGVEKPKFSFDDMYGADPVKQQLKRTLDLVSGRVTSPYKVPKSALILLHGPPGTGKTMTGQCMASYLNCNFKYKPATSFKGSYVGETESNIRKLFNTARTYQPIVIFLDEIDSIGKTRSSRDPYTASALNELLTELNGIANNKGVIVVAATNRREDLDSALLSRVSYEIRMPLPNVKQRGEVLRGLLQDLPTSGIDYERISMITSGWSQRGLAGLKGELANKLAFSEISVITTGVLEDLIGIQPSNSNHQTDLVGGLS